MQFVPSATSMEENGKHLDCLWWGEIGNHAMISGENWDQNTYMHGYEYDRQIINMFGK